MSQLTSLRTNFWIVNGIIIISLAGVIVGFNQFNGLYGQDSHAYLKFAKELKAYILTHQPTSEFFWPIAYPLLGAIVGLTGLPIVLVMQLISFLAFVSTLYTLNKLIYTVFSKYASLFILLGAITEVYFARGGFISMSDMLSCFFIIQGTYQFICWRKNQSIKNYLLLLLFSVLAFFTRYPAIIIVAPMIIYSSFYFFKKLPFIIKIILGGLISASLFYLININNQFLTQGLHLFSEWEFINGFRMVLSEANGINHNTVPNTLYIFGNLLHLGYLSFGFFLLPFYKKIKFDWVILTGVILYLFLLFGLATQNYRFLIIIHPIILFFLFPAFEGLINWLKSKKLATLFIIGILFFNLYFFTYSFSKTLKAHTIEIEIIKELKKINTSVPIYSFYVDQSFPSYEIENEVRNFYFQEYPSFEKGALVIFNKSQFQKQWKGHSVMNNWYQLEKNYQLDTLAKLNSNWRIYRIR